MSTRNERRLQRKRANEPAYADQLRNHLRRSKAPSEPDAITQLEELGQMLEKFDRALDDQGSNTTATIKYDVEKFPSDLTPPSYETPTAACMDIRAAVTEPVVIEPGSCEVIPTGLYVELAPNEVLRIYSRSGLARKHLVQVLNAPGTIDSDYRGEIGIILFNHGSEDFVVERGDRVAQMDVGIVRRINWEPVKTLSETERGAGGYGSTGISAPLEPVPDLADSEELGIISDDEQTTP